jgi:hypothetical protein
MAANYPVSHAPADEVAAGNDPHLGDSGYGRGCLPDPPAYTIAIQREAIRSKGS